MKSQITGTIIAISALGMIGASLAGPREMTALEKSIRDYRKWVCINPKPLFIPEAAATLCRSALPSELPPHGGRYVRVYVSSAGSGQFMSAHPQFPVGTIIIKEKMTDPKS